MSIDAYIKGILSDIDNTERNGSPATDHLGSWKEPGRMFRSDPCYDCGGRHKTTECMAGNPRPGKGLIGPWFLSQTGYKTFIGPVEGL